MIILKLIINRLEASSEAENQMDGALLRNVVVGESSGIFQLLARKDQALLVGRDALFVRDLGLHCGNVV